MKHQPHTQRSVGGDGTPLKDAQAGGPALFDVQPCRTDPLFRLLLQRWQLSPLSVAALWLGLNTVSTAVAFAVLGPDAPAFGASPLEAGVSFYLTFFAGPVAFAIATAFYSQVGTMFEELYRDGIIQPPLQEYNRFLRDLDRGYNARWFHLVALSIPVLQFGVMLVGHAGMMHAGFGWLDAFLLLIDFVFGCTAWYVALVLIAKIVVTSLAIRRLFRWPANVHALHADGVGGMHDVARVCSTMALTGLTASSVSALYLLAGHVSVMALVVSVVPMSFVWVLQGAHVAMRDEKRALLREIEVRSRPLIAALRSGSRATGNSDREDTEALLRLMQLRACLQELRTWPLNTQAVVQITLSVAVPLCLLLLQFVLQHVVKK